MVVAAREEPVERNLRGVKRLMRRRNGNIYIVGRHYLELQAQELGAQVEIGHRAAFDADFGVYHLAPCGRIAQNVRIEHPLARRNPKPGKSLGVGLVLRELAVDDVHQHAGQSSPAIVEPAVREVAKRIFRGRRKLHRTHRHNARRLDAGLEKHWRGPSAHLYHLADRKRGVKIL